MADFKIEFDTNIPIPAEAAAVPEKIYKAVCARMRGLKRIVIQHEAAKSRFAKINGFKLDGTAGKSTTCEADEIGNAIMFAINAHFDQLRKGDALPPPQNYRIFFHVADTSGEIQRPSTEYLYNPAEESVDVEDDDERDSKDAAHESRMERLLTRYEQQNEQLHARNMEMAGALNSLSTSHVTNLAPVMSMLSFMGQAWMTGAQMQQNALHAMFDQRQAEVAETHADRRMDKLIDAVKGPITTLVKAKYGIDLSKIDDEEDDDDDDDPPPRKSKKEQPAQRPAWDGVTRDGADTAVVVPASPPDGAAPAPASEPAQASDEGQGEPAAMLLQELGRTITPSQWNKLATVFGAKLKLLTRLLEAPTDKAALQRYKKLTTPPDGVELEHMGGLKRLLTAQQSELLDMLEKVMERVAANWD